MNEFVNPDFKDVLNSAGMADFSSLWDRKDPWFEKPNQGRTKDGWSGVCRLEIDGHSFFLKKQENFLAYSITKPLGQSLVEREFSNLRNFNEHKIPAMTVVYFGVRRQNGKLQGMLMTEALDEYQAVDEVWKAWENNSSGSLKIKRKVLNAIADLISLMHGKGLIHSGLYPKHIFIQNDFAAGGQTEAPECRLIDLEKARKAAFRSKRQFHDLDKLNRYSNYWTRTDRLAFLLRYLGEKTCNSEVRNFLKKLQSSAKK